MHGRFNQKYQVENLQTSSGPSYYRRDDHLSLRPRYSTRRPEPYGSSPPGRARPHVPVVREVGSALDHRGDDPSQDETHLDEGGGIDLDLIQLDGGPVRNA